MNIFNVQLHTNLRTQRNKKNNSGFTIIEMIIAVFIFTLSLSALMVVSSRGLRAARTAQNQVIADYLALESIEIVRNIRDGELLDRDGVGDWSDLFDQDGCWTSQINGTTTGCSTGFVNLSDRPRLFPCDGDDCTVFYNESVYLYRQFIGGVPAGNYEDIGFRREVRFTQIPGNTDELIVTVIVTWAQGQVEYTQNLFLWV